MILSRIIDFVVGSSMIFGGVFLVRRTISWLAHKEPDNSGADDKYDMFGTPKILTAANGMTFGRYHNAVSGFVLVFLGVVFIYASVAPTDALLKHGH